MCNECFNHLFCTAYCSLHLSSASADARGLATACFVDLGAEFLVADATGEPPLTRLVASITQEENGAVFYFAVFMSRCLFRGVYVAVFILFL